MRPVSALIGAQNKHLYGRNFQKCADAPMRSLFFNRLRARVARADARSHTAKFKLYKI
jgi:hypothetical protein